jgi:predicted DNA-binding transcriptional regulator
MDQSIKNQLISLGLNEGEINVYLNLLKFGSCSIVELSRKSSIARTTLYENISKLLKKGLVVEIISKNKKLYTASDPEKIRVVLTNLKLDFESKIKQLDKIEGKMTDVIKSIYSAIPKSEISTGNFYFGADSVRRIYLDIIAATKKYSFADLEKYYQLFPEDRPLWNKSYDDPEMEMFDIVMDNEVSREIEQRKPHRYHMKFFPKELNIHDYGLADFIVYDDKLAIIQLDPDNLMGVVIESYYIVSSMRALHKIIWSLLP